MEGLTIRRLTIGRLIERLKRIYFILLLFVAFSASAEMPFRGAWIATVANIDWPSEEAVGNDSLQQSEMLFLLDSLESLGINAIIFQVRPTADALYRSKYEPVSHWLTGKQGDSLTYDPLEWTIEQAHKRGMEVHVWLNPYRVNLAKTDTSVICADHVWRKHR